MSRPSLAAPPSVRDTCPARPVPRSGEDRTPWLAGQAPNPNASLDLFCLPYAGGGAAIYHRWRDLLPEYVQVCPIELPGRGHRMAETPYLRLAPLVRAMAGALGPGVGRPYALFGHSMGGLLAFELTRALRAAGRPLPAHLFVSAIGAPGTRSARPLLANASDDDVKQELRALNGTPQLVLDNDELMQLVLPVVRADFSVLETYEYRDEPRLDVPITVFGGDADHVVPPSVLPAWCRQSSRGARIQLFRGGHFYLHTAEPDLVAAVGHTLRSIALVLKGAR